MPIFLRTIEIDPATRFPVAAAVLFGLGFLLLPFGSLGTLLFFVAALVALIQVLRGQTRLSFDRSVRFAMIVALIYFAVDVLSVVIYENRGQSWVAPVGSLHFLVFPLLLAALSEASAVDPIRVFVRGVRLGAILAGIIAAIQIVAGLDRAIGGMINPIIFGGAATLFAFVSLIGSFDEDRRGRIIAGLAFAAGIFAAAVSQSRGPWLALPFFAVTILFYLRARHGNRAAAIVAAGLGLLTILVLSVAWDRVTERVNETLSMFRGFEFGQAADNEDDAFSLDQRALMMVYGLEAFGQRPILGYGPHNAVAEVTDRAAADGYTIGEFRHLHNEFLTEAVGNGIVGLVTLLLVLAAPLVTALRSPRDRAFADRVVLAALLSSGTAIFGLTSLAFGHDITNTVYVGGLLVVCLSTLRSRRVA